MVKRDELIQAIHEIIGSDLLEKAQTIDQNANGVQIHGVEEVTKLALGVSANLDFFQEAVASGAQFCLFHHGLPLHPKYHIYNSRLDLSQQKLLKYVFAHDLTVAGYHYALDAHPIIGNNAAIIRKLDAKMTDETYYEDWGWIAEFDKPQSVEELAVKCSKIFAHDVFAVYAGPKQIKRFGVCSGGARPSGRVMHEIQEKKLDLHLSGEIAEWSIAMAKQAEFNYFSCGHYATEVFGVQELGKKIKEKFKDKLEVEFIDIPNPL